jgi:hypothetical protein
MKTTTSIFITAIMFTLTLPALAENSAPPSGPYRSINDTDQYNLSQNNVTGSQPEHGNKSGITQPDQLNKNYQNSSIDHVPEWVIQRQAEMQNLRMQYNGRTNTNGGNQAFQQPEIPEWVKQRQAQIEQWNNQANRPPQGWNNQPPPQWGQNYAPSMRTPNNAPLPPNNRMNFPSAPGPVFRPGITPPGFNNQPGYRNSYPPAWR